MLNIPILYYLFQVRHLHFMFIEHLYNKIIDGTDIVKYNQTVMVYVFCRININNLISILFRNRVLPGELPLSWKNIAYYTLKYFLVHLCVSVAHAIMSAAYT